jgi:cytochrome P450
LLHTNSVGCQQHSEDDPRKTAALARQNMTFKSESVEVIDAELARGLLRSRHVKQAGFGAEEASALQRLNNPPVAMVDGEVHRKMRAATARFFSPAAVRSHYTPLMERTAENLIARFRCCGEERLENVSMDMSVTIAAEIVGLTSSDMKAMSVRLGGLLGGGAKRIRKPLGRALRALRARYHNLMFFMRDVRPAIAQRRTAPENDVISHLLSLDYSEKEILVECLIYAIAGMATTREFIVIAFWRMMEDESLRERFLSLERGDQILLLEEVLRTEPIIGQLARRSTQDIELPLNPPVMFAAGTLFEIDVRAANADPSVVGSRPLAIDPDRPTARRTGGSMFAFGDGPHRCPGSQVALLESAIFLDRLLRVPGIRLASEPIASWQAMIAGYELSNAIITCDRA